MTDAIPTRAADNAHAIGHVQSLVYLCDRFGYVLHFFPGRKLRVTDGHRGLVFEHVGLLTGQAAHDAEESVLTHAEAKAKA